MSIRICDLDNERNDKLWILRSGEVNERAVNDKREAVKILRKEEIRKSFFWKKRIFRRQFEKNILFFYLTFKNAWDRIWRGAGV